MISFDQFKAMDMRIAKITAVDDHPNADKLYLLKVELGGTTKNIVAGIKQYYTKDELLNREIVIVNNLEPAIIRGVQSEGMLLATKDSEKLAILIPEKEVKTGSPIS